MEHDFPARLLDGRSAVPQRGRLSLDHSELRFAAEAGGAHTWSMREVRSVQRVANEVHLILPGADPQDPEQRLSVLDRAFEDVIDAAQKRFGASARVGVQRVARRIGVLGWAVIALVAVPLSYAVYAIALPHLHVLVSHERAAALGELVHEAMGSTWATIEDTPFELVAGRMVEELREPDLPFDLRVGLVDLDEPNAVALPGGRILVCRGLLRLAPSPDALAGVLAHEIAHVEERHGLQHILRSIGLIQFAANAVGGGIDGLETAETIVEFSSGLLILKHSRDHEREADRVALSKLHRTGRSARGLMEFLELCRAENGDLPESMGWIRTHPLGTERIESLERAVAAETDPRPWMSAGEWATFQARYAD